MDVRRLLIFRAVAHRGSIAAAARDLGWTQPAVSQHLRQLEREARTPLVVRQSRGIDLTEAGRVALEHADAIAARLHTAEQELAALADLSAGTVRVAAFPSASAVLVPRALSAITARHPGLDLQLEEAEPPEALQLVRAGDVDLALSFSYPEAADDGDSGGLVREAVGRDLIDVVLPRDHQLARRRRLSLADLAGERWIAGCVRCRDHLLNVCAAAGFQPDIRHTTDDYVVVQALVAQGLAVSLLPRLALASYTHPDVVTRPVKAAGERTVYLLHHQAANRTPAVAAVIAGLTHTATDLS